MGGQHVMGVAEGAGGWEQASRVHPLDHVYHGILASDVVVLRLQITDTNRTPPFILLSSQRHISSSSYGSSSFCITRATLGYKDVKVQDTSG
jgi:hypothetical protein